MSNINKIRLSGQTYNIQDLNATKTVELTQAEYDALSPKDPNVFYIITDAEGADLSNYYTKTETDNAITAATSTKQDTLVSGTNIKTINNQSIIGEGNITIGGGSGGGKTVKGGTNISITTGETADTINCILPISARADNNNGNLTNVVVGDSNNVSSGAYFTYAEGYETKATGAHGAHAEGYNTTASGQYGAHAEGWRTEARGSRCHAEGEYSKAFGNSSHAEGYETKAMAYASHSEGWYTIANNQSEHASGQYNNSVSASTTWGDSGNTLFSVGNGKADNARHNAFEIRQNGDIYISKDGQDVKLQDQLGGGGGSITIDQSLDSGSTNPVANSAITKTIYNETARFKGYASDGYLVSVSARDDGNAISIDAMKIKTLGNSTSQTGVGTWLYTSTINGKKSVSSSSSNTKDFSLVETSAITTSVTSSSTDVQVPSAKAVYDQFGGLKLVKLTQSEYDSLTTKDNSTLYVIVN